MPQDQPSGSAQREHFAQAITAWLVAFGLADPPRLRGIVRAFVDDDCERGTAGHLLGLFATIAAQLDAAASADPDLAEARRKLGEAIAGFGPVPRPHDGREVIGPLANAPRTMAEQLRARLHANEAAGAVTVEQLEDAFREELLRGGWRELQRGLKQLARVLTRLGEPPSDGLMTAVERGRDLLQAIGTPRPGGPLEAYWKEWRAHCQRNPHPTPSGWPHFEPSFAVALPPHIARSE